MFYFVSYRRVKIVPSVIQCKSQFSICDFKVAFPSWSYSDDKDTPLGRIAEEYTSVYRDLYLGEEA